MGFGTELQGRESHDALLHIQDTEIRLLENVKSCLHKRIDGDKKYVASLSAFVQIAQKLEHTEFHAYCAVFKAWESIIKGTEKLAELLQHSLDGLTSKVMERLSSLIIEKKSTRKHYEDERNRLEKDFTKIKDEVQKNKQDYIKFVDRVRLDRAKYEDTVAKGKGVSKVEDARTRYQKSSIQLHLSHNKYIVSLCEVQSHQEHYRSSTLPYFLDHHQFTQEILVQQCKSVLEEYQRLTTFGSKDHIDAYNSIDRAVKDVKPEQEYTGEFMTKHKSEPFSPITFEFDGKILDDYQGSLVANEVALDDFTAENLTQLKTTLTDDIAKMKQQITDMEKDKAEQTKRVKELQKQLATLSDGDLSEYTEKRKTSEDLKRKIAETESLVATKSDMLKEVVTPIEKLGDGLPPAAMDLPEVTPDEVVSNSVSDTASTSGGGGVGGKISMLTKKIKNPFSGRGVKSTPMENGRKVSENYEENNAVGSGDIVGGGASPKSLEDEEWFHGVLPREEVQRLLVRDGDFLVRESKNKRTNETQYVLSVYWQGYRHFIIQFHEGGWRFEGPCFPTVPELVNHQYSSNQPVTNKSQSILSNPIVRESWELRNDDIALETKIGNGNFGEVFRGIYKRTGEVVAVKTCKDTLSEDQRKKFLMEGRILKQYDHPNIVKFIGIAAQRQPVMILMEYVTGGALLSFLRKEGKKQTRLKAAQMCLDASSGMEYLSANGCIHRDLAARNCLVGTSNVVKISDFGMSREEEEYTVSDGMKQIPIKWTAPEALNFGKYTTQCDVWSFGILMYEIFSNGQTPYPGWTNAIARDSVEQGYRMPVPAGCPDSIYKVMLRCWDKDPSIRINFQQVHKQLHSIVDKPPKTENFG